MMDTDFQNQYKNLKLEVSQCQRIFEKKGERENIFTLYKNGKRHLTVDFL